jgi:glycosyltransferase involved in cell wall biosynthesis
MNSALPEVVGEWATLINPYDPSELAVVMRELLHDVPTVTHEDKARIADRYSWERAAHQILETIDRVA